MLESPPRPNYVLDAGEANCTRLILLIFDQIKQMQPQEVLEVIGYDPSAAVDIAAWCRQTKNPLVYIYGVNWSIPGYTEGVYAAGFSPMLELWQTFEKNGGKMIVCPPCFCTRNLDENGRYANSELAGGARLAEILGSGAACISY